MPIFKITFPYIYARDKNNVKSDFILLSLMYKKHLMFPMNYTDFDKKKHLLRNPNVILIFISDKITF